MPQPRNRPSKSVVTPEVAEVLRMKFISPSQLAELLDEPLSTIYDWNSKRTAPPRHKFGRHTRYLMSDVVEWIEKRRVS